MPMPIPLSKSTSRFRFRFRFRFRSESPRGGLPGRSSARVGPAFPVVAAALSIAIAISAEPARGDGPRPGNIVLFVSDDHGRDAGCYGSPDALTPNLDALAAEGARFEKAFCTTASCSASRSVILTGLHNHANGQYGHEHAYHKFSTFPNVKSLPVLLAEAGYVTARIGKFHVAPESVYKFDRALPGNARDPVGMAREAGRFLREQPPDKPVFLYFCTADPHRSGDAAEELPGKPDRFGNPPPGATRSGVPEVVFRPEWVSVPPFLPDTLETRAELAQYLQSVARVDAGIGALVEELKAAGRWDDTLFVYISDNGIAMPGAKTTLYEPGANLPCVVRAPGRPGGVVARDALVSWADLTPTLLDYAGAAPSDAPSRFHGRSFLALLDGDPAKAEGWDEVFMSHTFHEITMYYPMRVLRERRFKLIWNVAHPLPVPFASDLWASPTWRAQLAKGPDAPFGKRTVATTRKRPEFELYDLEADPHEAVNLAGDPARRETLERMKTRLRELQKVTNDPWILKWEYE